MKIKAFLLAILVQAFFMLLFFIGGLLDPLLGLLVIGIYFFGVGYFLTYQFIFGKMLVRSFGSNRR